MNGPKLVALSLLFVTCGVNSDAAPPKIDFERDVLPVFKQSCGPCHITAAMGRLRLDSEGAILRGGQTGPAVFPGKSKDSLLIKRILGLTDSPRMPMGAAPLPNDKVEVIRAWIDQNDFSRGQKQPTSKTISSLALGSTIFAKQVRPILAARCYSCHGPDIQQNGLRLDSLASILKGSDYGAIVIPGKSDESRLIHRLLAKERPQMPYGGPPLSQGEVQTIARWIDAGALGPDDTTTRLAAGRIYKHWAYMKPVQPKIPALKNTTWVHNPIDSLILARLEKEGLKPAPEADRATLIRRVYLDITGLPPSPHEVDAFLNDNSPGAYEKVVDRLFASPHYGEHWARQWLDLARYADSNGYEKDRKREAWAYRDWVIRALNANMSFRQFTIDQIAGDMLPDPTKDQLIATGFNRNSMLNQEGGIDVNEYYYYSQVDRVNTTAAVWLGSTLGCAQCHNHKFDPFTQKDYYRFLAFFNNSQHEITGNGDHWMKEPAIELPTGDQERASTSLRAEVAALKERLRTQTPELDDAQRVWEANLKHAEADWTVLTPLKSQSLGGATLKPMNDGSILATGKNPQADTYIIEGRTNRAGNTGIRLEVIPDESLPRGGPGRDPAGNFFLSNFVLEIAPASNPTAFTRVALRKAVADESQEDYEIEKVLKKKDEQISGWAIDELDKKQLRRQAVFVSSAPFGTDTGAVLRITLSHQMRHASRNIGRFRLSLTKSSEPQFITEVPAKLRPIIDKPEPNRNDEDRRELAAAYRDVSPILEPTRKQIEALDKQVKALGITTAMVMREQPAFTRPSAYVRERGTFTSPGELVYADVPSALGSLPKDAMPNRLGLAEWLVSNDNPLTARVTVNHFWEALFGRGIVGTAEDFGTQGDPPSNPELLDWLAVQFMRNGWDMKRIQRLIVTSATYRQSSTVTPELLARDPYNLLYARGARFRLDAETVHDTALAVSGLLNDKLYGPPVFPYQPEGIWNIPYSDDKWIESPGEDRYRRAIYTFIRRSAPYPSLITYDAPSREFCTVRRVRTNTPLQALTSLNDPFFFDAARALARRVMNEGGTSTPDRVNYAFQLTVARKPTQREARRIQDFYKEQVQQYSGNSDLPWKILQLRPGSVPNASEVAAWAMVSNVLLNTDEAITRE
jgi:hypothetical protein